MPEEFIRTTRSMKLPCFQETQRGDLAAKGMPHKDNACRLVVPY